jgi:hypothetical protein
VVKKTNDWNAQKTHEILHFPEQICEFGHLMNADTGVGERGLKYWAKKPACSTRKGSIDVFTESTTKQVVDTMILWRASEVMNIGNHMFTCTQSHTQNTTLASYGRDNNIPGVLVGEPKFKLVGRSVDDHVECTCIWFGVMAKRTKQVFLPRLQNYWKKNILLGKKTSIGGYRMKADVVFWGIQNIDSPTETSCKHIQTSNQRVYDWCIVKNIGNYYFKSYLFNQRGR